MDEDNGGTLSETEIRDEFERMGIHRDEASNIMKFAAGESSGSVLQRWTSKVQRASSYLSSSSALAEPRDLSLDQFIKVIVYVLDNSIDNFSAADVCTLGALLHEYDTDGNGLMDFDEFSNIALDLVRTSFVFNGPESLGTMHLHQLDALRLHQWKSRELEEREEGETVNTNRENALGGKQEIFSFDQDGIDNPNPPEEEKEPEPFVPLYTLRAQETEELIKICDAIQELSKPYDDLRERAKNLHDGRDLVFVVDKGSRIVALVSALTFRLRRDIRKNWTSSAGVGRPTLAAAYRQSDTLRAVNVEAEKLKDMFKKQGKCRRQSGAMHMRKLICYDVCIQCVTVLEIAFRLRKEGVITEPALEWDGSLGPEENVVIERLGFLLNAYTVQAWYWEIVEMFRKLILTVALAALYQGEPAQLAGSLLTIFIFLVLHMLLKPYLNQGLNIFQRLALISQWFTVFGGLMFVVTDLLTLQDPQSDENGKAIISWCIVFVNAVSTSLYPMYRFFNAWSESGEIDFSFVKEALFKFFEFFMGTQLAASLLATCGCLRKIKAAAEEAKEVQEQIDEVKTNVMEISGEVCTYAWGYAACTTLCACACVCVRARCVRTRGNHTMYVDECASFVSHLVYLYTSKQVQGKLQDKLLENDVFSNMETLYADGKAMKETLEEAQGLVEETRDSVKAFKKSAHALKGEAFGGGDGEAEEAEEEEEEEGAEEEGRGEEGPEEGLKSVLFGRKLSSLAEFMSADTNIAILSCVPLALLEKCF